MPRDTRTKPEYARPFPRRLVAYLDILGWTELTLSGNDARIFTSLAFAEGKLDFADGQLAAEDNIRKSMFSDSIAYSSGPSTEAAGRLVFQVMSSCISLLDYGHYIRGGASIGPLGHAGDMIAGRALVEAVHLERSVAKYPRIVVSDEAAPLLVLKRVTLPEVSQTFEDSDGVRCLEFFPVEVDGHQLQAVQARAAHIRETVEEDLKETFNPKKYSDHCRALERRTKYQWMLRYLDRVIAAPTAPPDGHRLDLVRANE
jgi:hypothetical protein